MDADEQLGQPIVSLEQQSKRKVLCTFRAAIGKECEA
jgi:hypothetical protein